MSNKLTRRQLLKASLFGGLLVVGGGGAYLKLVDPEPASQGYQVLRSSDLLVLSSIAPVVLAGAEPKTAAEYQAYFQALDYKLAHFSNEKLKLLTQLLDVLANHLTRGPLTGIWRGWASASTADIQAFLQRWKNSSISLLAMGQSSLTQLLLLARYSQTSSWEQCGYPGPPDFLG